VLKDSDESKVLSLDSEFKTLYLETGSSADDLDATIGKYVVWRNNCVCLVPLEFIAYRRSGMR
jgi:hypothetical protein